MSDSDNPDGDEVLRRQEQLIQTDIRFSGQFGQRPVGLPQMKVVQDPGANLAPDVQRNERNLRSLRLPVISPVPEMLAAYGAIALFASASSALQGSIIGFAFIVSCAADLLGVLLIPRRGSLPSGYYALGAVALNIATLLWAMVSASFQSVDPWTAAVAAFALVGFGAYPLLILRRNWGYFKRTE